MIVTRASAHRHSRAAGAADASRGSASVAAPRENASRLNVCLPNASGPRPHACVAAAPRFLGISARTPQSRPSTRRVLAQARRASRCLAERPFDRAERRCLTGERRRERSEIPDRAQARGVRGDLYMVGISAGFRWPVDRGQCQRETCSIAESAARESRDHRRMAPT
jgi:hypothetical protein